MAKEALRYLGNARGILKSAKLEGSVYRDVKMVQEACGIAYLAVLKAIDEYLLEKGFSKKELPKSVDAYRKTLQKYLLPRNGKLLKEFEVIYDELHIAGYYRGFLRSKDVVNVVIGTAERFIKKLE